MLLILSLNHVITENTISGAVWNPPPPSAKRPALICLTQRRCLMRVESSQASLKSYLQTLLLTLCTGFTFHRHPFIDPLITARIWLSHWLVAERAMGLVRGGSAAICWSRQLTLMKAPQGSVWRVLQSALFSADVDPDPGPCRDPGVCYWHKCALSTLLWVFF